MTTSTSAPQTVGAQAKNRTAMRFAGVAAGNFLVIMDTSVLNVALPNLRADLHASATTLPWAVNAYLVIFAGLMLASGSVADRWGPRRVYRVALGAFAVLSLACAAAPTIGALIAGRALLGAAGAGMVPASVALLAALYPNPARRARAVGTWAAVTGAGMSLGPLFGGLLVAAGGWRLVFLVNPPIAVFAMLCTAGLSAHRGSSGKPVDAAGIAASTIGLASLTLGLIDGGTSGWGRPSVLVALAVAVLAFVLLVPIERRAAVPVLPGELLRLPRPQAALVGATMASLCYYGVLFTLTLWFQGVDGLSPVRTSIAFLPMTLPICVVPIFGGRLVAKLGARPVMLAGLAFAVLCGVLLTFAGQHPSAGLLVDAMLALGFAGPLAIPAATTEIANSAPTHIAATGQGALNATRQAGSALGVAVLGMLPSLHATGVVLGALAAAGLLIIAARRQ